MSGSSTFDVNGYYAAKEPYERLIKEAAPLNATTEKKQPTDDGKKGQEIDPLLVPTFSEVKLSKQLQEEDQSSAKK
ncbi:MAG: hypothetical protein M1830_010562 [Pleopsidium flavum]|nr:MAG: hypothetical protein M1830_010562 [Pleopsidium flavum]